MGILGAGVACKGSGRPYLCPLVPRTEAKTRNENHSDPFGRAHKSYRV